MAFENEPLQVLIAGAACSHASRMPWFKRNAGAGASSGTDPHPTANTLNSGSASGTLTRGSQGAVSLKVEGEYRIKARLDLCSDRDVGSVIEAVVESGILIVGQGLRLNPCDASRSPSGPFEVLGISKDRQTVNEAGRGARIILQLRGFPRGSARKGDRLQG